MSANHGRLRKFGSLSLAVVTAMILASTAFAEVRYNITGLGTLGGASSRPYAINNNGQVVGFSFLVTGVTHAFLWDGGVMADLGTLGGNASVATDINDAGDVVGSSRINTSSNVRRAFLWRNGSMTNLGTLPSPSGLDYIPYGINGSGQVVGQAFIVAVYNYSFLWEGGVMSKLPDLGDRYVNAFDISGSGVIVGDAMLAEASYSRAFIRQNGVVTSLGTLGGDYSGAIAVNDFSQVVGWASSIPGNYDHAFLWEGGMMTDLGTLGGSRSTANDINRNGQVVGNSLVPGEATHAFLWDKGQMKDLNDLLPPDSGWVLTTANGINDQGWIVGSGSYLGGPEQGFLLVPEPATLSLLAVGGLVALRRRR
jgi:probable HAF family extracellular repeat protein